MHWDDPMPREPSAAITAISVRKASAGEDCWRQLDAQRSGDAEIDPKIALGGTFERQVARLCAFQNAIKLRDQVTKSVGKIRPERHKAPIGDPVGRRKNRRFVA